MSSSDLALSVRGLSKSYTIRHNAAAHDTMSSALLHRVRHPFERSVTETFWALKGVDFDVHKGDVVGIIGRNGAGKSTLLKILSRITEPTSGEVQIYGHIGSLLEVGSGFHPELTGRENIFLNGAILGMKRRQIERQFDAIVDFAGVEKFIDTPVKRYSSGMYVRLAFSVAAFLDPDILILDEVLAVGDASFQKKCIGKVRSVASQEGRTVLFVSHNTGAVKSLCSSALWLADGQVREYGATSSVLTNYLKGSGGDAPCVLDLKNLPRVGAFGQRLRLLSCEFNRGCPVLHGERFVARFTFETTESIEGIGIDFAFANQDGVRLLTVDSDLGRERYDCDGPRRASVTAELETMMLEPGSYTLAIGVRSGEYSGLDYVPECGVVQILPGPSTPGNVMRNEGGGVRPLADWNWQGLTRRAA